MFYELQVSNHRKTLSKCHGFSMRGSLTCVCVIIIVITHPLSTSTSVIWRTFSLFLQNELQNHGKIRILQKWFVLVIPFSRQLIFFYLFMPEIKHFSLYSSHCFRYKARGVVWCKPLNRCSLIFNYYLTTYKILFWMNGPLFYSC